METEKIKKIENPVNPFLITVVSNSSTAEVLFAFFCAPDKLRASLDLLKSPNCVCVIE